MDKLFARGRLAALHRSNHEQHELLQVQEHGERLAGLR